MKTIYCTLKLLAKLQKPFDDKFVIFSTLGISSPWVFRDTVFRLVDDDDDFMIKNISQTIHREYKNVVSDKDKYTIRVDRQMGLILIEQPFSLPWFTLSPIAISSQMQP